MTSPPQHNRAIRACRDAGLPVIDERACTCHMRGMFVVIRAAEGLRLVLPCTRRCPVHDVQGKGGGQTPGACRRPARAAERLGSVRR